MTNEINSARNVRKPPFSGRNRLNHRNCGTRTAVPSCTLTSRDRSNRIGINIGTVDDCSGFIWGTARKSKKHAVRAQVEFLKWLPQKKSVATKMIYGINCLQSNRGGEFNSGPTSVRNKRSLFEKVCRKMDISRRYTSAKSLNHNCEAERANWTLFNAVRCNLIDSGMG